MAWTKKQIEDRFKLDMESKGLLVIPLPQAIRKESECNVSVRGMDQNEIMILKSYTFLKCDIKSFGRETYLVPDINQDYVPNTQAMVAHTALSFHNSKTKWVVIDSTSVEETQALEVPNGVLVRHTDRRFTPPVASMTHIPFVSLEEIKEKFKK